MLNKILTSEDLKKVNNIKKSTELLTEMMDKIVISTTKEIDKQIVSLPNDLSPKTKKSRLPIHIIEALSKINHIKRKLIQKNGREPTITEISEEIALPKEKIEKILQYAREPARLDKEITEDTTATLAEYVTSKNSNIQLGKAKVDELKRIALAFSSLCPRDDELNQLTNIFIEKIKEETDGSSELEKAEERIK